MKKVLSVLLAAAMVMGMSVSAFAADYSVSSSGSKEVPLDLEWANVHQVRNGKEIKVAAPDATGKVDEHLTLKEGDTLFFSFYNEDKVPTVMPNNWIVKIVDAEYVEDAELVALADDNKYGIACTDGQLFVKVTMESDFDAYEEEAADEVCEFWMYIKNKNNKVESEKANVHYGFVPYNEEVLCEEDVTDVVVAEANTIYSLCDGTDCTCDFKSSEVVFEIADSVLVTTKMWTGEEYLIKGSVDAKWSKELSKQYDTDIELLTIESNMDVREVLFESAKDNKQVVEFVDGELVAVDSEFVTKYEVIDGVVLAKGYIADAEENGTYALISADIELIEVEEEATKEETKENPSTGANDFVGAAVALAVVSVAAAGALALKK